MDFNMLEKLFNRNKKDIERICKDLKIDKSLLDSFEEAYKVASIDNYSSLKKSHQSNLNKTLKESSLDELKAKIVEELISQTKIWTYDGKKQEIKDELKKITNGEFVTREEILNVPENLRPLLTGTMMKVDINGDSGITLLTQLRDYLTSSDPQKQKRSYNMFRQGLDLLDLDQIVYMMLDQNKNSMGYWLPRIVEEVQKDNFFIIPKTTIIKVPITLLQLPRIGYEELNRTTLDIVNEYCKKAFNLNTNNKYFIKTGTYSSKFDFRNALVQGKSEVESLGEYLLFIHSQALSMARYDLSGLNRPIIYGVSTTNEWVVRDFIEDKENNLTIYHGLPLHTEYRVFVDFDEKIVLGIHPYWEKDKLISHFESTIRGATNFLEKMKNENSSSILNYEEELSKAYQSLTDAKHDLITYMSNYEELNKRYLDNKDIVCKHIENIIKNCDITGQWSIDVMQNGSEFYIIDMQGAYHSTYYKETVPEEYQKPDEENWLPILKEKKTKSFTLRRVEEKNK